MLRAGLVLLTIILGVCSFPLNGKADGGSKDDTCQLQTAWIPQPEPLDDAEMGILFPGSFRGTSIRAIIDTGMPNTVLNLDFAKRAGFRLGAESPSKMLFGGSVTFSELGPVDLTLADNSLHLEAASAANFADFELAPEARVDLIVGRDVLMRCAIEIDADRNLVRIGAPPFPPAGAIVVPITYLGSGGTPIVPVSLGPKLEVIALLDTGAQRRLTLEESLLPIMEARGSIQGTRETTVVPSGQGGVIEKLAILPKVSIGAMPLDNVETRFSYLSVHKVGVIGLHLLVRFNSIIDLRHDALWLSPRQTPVPPTIKSTSGLLVDPHDHLLRIRHVMLNSPAAAIGLTEKDQICAIDGQPIPDDYWGSSIRLWSKDKPGRVVELTLCDGREKRLTLQEFY